MGWRRRKRRVFVGIGDDNMEHMYHPCMILDPCIIAGVRPS